jgi:hypothetical protein
VQQLKTRSAGDFTSTMQHARTSRRYPLKELMTFFCGDDEVERSASLGVTENVSTTGIAFLTDAAVGVGSSICLDLHLRSLTDEEKTILLHAEGIVMRVEPAGPQNKVAAEIRFQDQLDEDFAVSRTIQ